MSDLYQFPKDILIKMIATIREETRKEFEQKIVSMKEAFDKMEEERIYFCSHPDCVAMLSYLRDTHIVSGCESFACRNRLYYCDKHIN